MILATWRWLRGVLPRARSRVVVLVALSAVSGLAEAAAFVLVVRVALGATTDLDEPLRLPVLDATVSDGVLVGAAVGLAVVTLALNLVVARVGARTTADVAGAARSRAIGAYTAASWEAAQRERHGAIQETMTSLVSQTSLATAAFVSGVSAAVGLTAFLVTAAVVDAAATVVVVAFGLLLALVLQPLTRLTRRRSARLVRASTQFAEDVGHLSTLAAEVHAFGVRDQVADAMEQANRRATARVFASRFAQRAGSTMYRDIAVLFLALAIGVMVWWDRGLLVGAGTVVVLVVRSVASAQSVHRAVQSINEHGPFLEEFESRVNRLRAGRRELGARTLDTIESLELDQVTYDYDHDVPALRGLSLRVGPGEAIGLLGPSGGGKSTLAKVLVRLLLPTTGRLLVNGVDHREFSDAAWTSAVAFVPQEPHLLDGTVADNIRFFRGDLDDATVVASARAAHLYDEIDALPEGFDTVLGPGRGGLSGGQVQRLAIARALAGRPRLLVMDEPTSALDPVSEAAIGATLAELHGTVTMVIVAHRRTTLEVCDRRYVVTDGSVAPDAVLVPGEGHA